MSRWGKTTDAGLRILRHLAGQSAPSQRAAVCKATGVSKSNIAEALARLEEAGLVRQIPRPRYAPLVEITPAGVAELHPAIPLSEQSLACLRYLAETEARSLSEVAAAGYTSNVVYALRRALCVDVDGLGLTDLGRDVVAGRRRVVPSAAVRERRPSRPVPRARCEEKPAPVVASPTSLANYRGVPHPPMPRPAERPESMSAAHWQRVTTIEIPRFS